MADPQRARKMADRIKDIVARRLEKGLRDPRLGFVTITDVRVTGDLQHASIFYTVYGTDEERRDSALALKAATGMLRSEVGRNITASTSNVTWYGPLGAVLLATGLVAAVVAARRGVIRGVGALLAFAPVYWLVALSVALFYQDAAGRFLMAPVALAGATWGWRSAPGPWRGGSRASRSRR